jgi:hypothetical protein
VFPHDSGTRRRDFSDFRDRLRRAVVRKDERAISAILHPDIQVDFGGASGPDAFLEHHVRNQDEDFWKEFGDVLAMGGRFLEPDEFAAPYTFTEFPGDLDGFSCMTVLGAGVRLREAPGATARVLALLDHDIVEAFGEDQRVADWVRVETADRRTGYVARRYLRSPLDHRAIFHFDKGRWWLTAYVAGE